MTVISMYVPEFMNVMNIKHMNYLIFISIKIQDRVQSKGLRERD